MAKPTTKKDKQNGALDREAEVDREVQRVQNLESPSNGKKAFLGDYEEEDEVATTEANVDQMDDMMDVLGDEDIGIVDSSTQVKIAPKRLAEEESAEKKVVARDQREGLLGHHHGPNDPPQRDRHAGWHEGQTARLHQGGA